MNLQQHVYAIQNLFNAGRIPEERRFSNTLVKHLFELNRSAITKNQLNKNYGLLEFNYQLICVQMELSSYSDCLECQGIDITCPIWKSKVKLPSIINYKEGLAIKVTTVEGNVISRLNLTNAKYNNYSVTQQPMFGWFISSGYLYVISDSPVQMVLVEAIFDAPSELENLDNCNGSSQDICLPMGMENYPLDGALVPMVYELTLNMMRQSSYPKDNLNDANNNQTMPQARNQN